MKQQMVYQSLMNCLNIYCVVFIDTVLLYFFIGTVLLSIISSHSSVNKCAAFFLYSHLQSDETMTLDQTLLQ